MNDSALIKILKDVFAKEQAPLNNLKAIQTPLTEFYTPAATIELHLNNLIATYGKDMVVMVINDAVKRMK